MITGFYMRREKYNLYLYYVSSKNWELGTCWGHRQLYVEGGGLESCEILDNYFHFVVKNNRIFICHIFFLTIMKQQIFLWICCCIFTKPLWQFQVRAGNYWAEILIDVVFYGYNSAGINGLKLCFTELLVAFTDQQCRLQIRWWQLLVRDAVY